MKFLQVPTCLAIVVAPYWILYTKTALKDNFNNAGLALRAFGYYLMAVALKVFLMASGVPELIGHYALGERLVMSLLNCSVYIGLMFTLRGKVNSNTNISNIILGIGLGWSLPENIGRSLFEMLRCIRQHDHTDRLLYAALQSNLYLLSSVVITGLFFMWHRERRNRHTHTAMVAIAMFLFPVLSTFNELPEGEATAYNYVFLAVQAFVSYFFVIEVKRVFLRVTAPATGS